MLWTLVACQKGLQMGDAELRTCGDNPDVLFHLRLMLDFEASFAARAVQWPRNSFGSGRPVVEPAVQSSGCTVAEKNPLVRRVDEVRPWTDGRNQRSSGARSSWEYRALDRNRVACAGIYDCQERSPTGRFWIILGRPSDRPAYLTPLLQPRRVLRSTSPMERPGFCRA
jgi:hypothetical protein